MKSSFIKFVFVISLAFNISIIATAGYVVWRHRHRASMFGNMTRNERFIFGKIDLRPDQIKALNDKSAAFRADVDKKGTRSLAKERSSCPC